ncbi:MAG: parallel beta-helix domain-containing protein [Oligoflexus sp.]
MHRKDLPVALYLRHLCLLFILTIPSLLEARVIELAVGPALAYRAQAALDQALPGDTIVLPAGEYTMEQELAIAAPQVTLRGQGIDQTILKYDLQSGGPQGIVVTANYAIIEDLTLRNHPGDGIKSIGVDGIIIRRTKVEWTRRRHPENGGYGIYPVLSRNVLVEDNHIIGASDAGIYVGQSENIVVRRNLVEWNVAGIEIENSQAADVYENEATNNTGGVLVFDLPNLIQAGGRQTRVYRNHIHSNNLRNFAPAGNSVALIPQGTGILIMANDDVEIFENSIEDHNTTSIAIVSYHVTESAITDDRYDPIPEKIYIHHNKMRRAGRFPIKDGNALGFITGLHAFPFRVPHIAYDGIGQSDGTEGFHDAALEGERRICHFENDWDGNQREKFGNFHLHLSSLFSLVPGKLERNAEAFACQLPRLPEVKLDPWPEPASQQVVDNHNKTQAACSMGSGADVNWQAIDYDCPKLDDYKLFTDPLNPRENPNGNGVKYELNSPLFSDYSTKDRFLFLPPDSKMQFQGQGNFKLPVGTVLTKSFAFQADLRQDEETAKLVETRLLIHRSEGWRALVYRWNEDMTEANILYGGEAVPVHFIHHDGKPRSFSYQIPHLQRCSSCHVKQAPIGLQAKFLNHDMGLDGRQINQLEHWQELGLISGLPEDLDDVARLASWQEEGSIEARARAYLDANCAHCHSPSGQANSTGLFLHAEQAMNTNLGICKPPIAAGRGSGGILFDIVPGEPQNSILMERLASVEAGVMMPEIDKGIVHEEGLALIAEWIQQLQGSCKQ